MTEAAWCRHVVRFYDIYLLHIFYMDRKCQTPHLASCTLGETSIYTDLMHAPCLFSGGKKKRPPKTVEVQNQYFVLLCTHNAIPERDNTMPTKVSAADLAIVANRRGVFSSLERPHLPRLMTFFSTHQSPMTVKRNAKVLTMGTVKLNSSTFAVIHTTLSLHSRDTPKRKALE